jgi:hypothetical protein
MRAWSYAVVGGLVVAALLRPAAAEERAPTVFVYRGTVAVEPDGDATAEYALALGDEYGGIRKHVEDPGVFLRRVQWGGHAYEPDGADVRYDDASRSVRFVLPMRGLARSTRDGRWTLQLPKGSTVTVAGGAPRARADVVLRRSWPERVDYVGEFSVVLPAGAASPTWDAVRGALEWTRAAAPVAGEARLEATLEVPDRLMTCPYKVYAVEDLLSPQWVARTVFRNAGTGTVRDLQVRYRLAGYSEWSPWSRYASVAPGQTVVDVLFPVLGAEVARLRTSTPANLLVEWAWTDGGGQRRTGDDARKLQLLAGNDLLIQGTTGSVLGGWVELTSNVPLLAAWVTWNDPVVKAFAAMANKNAGGVMASQSDAAAEEVMRACYELTLRNDFTYQGPAAVTDKRVSYDERLVQNVRFPRDVVRDRSGTCIELACLYAAMIQSTGLEPFVVVIPGHCFPVVKLPKSGQLRGIEMTLIGGGRQGRFADFDAALAEGSKELVEAVVSGDFHLIALLEEWGRGVSNPELEDLSPAILNELGITSEGQGLPQPGTGAADPALLALAGTYDLAGGRIATGLPGGSSVGYSLDGVVIVDQEGRCSVTLKGSSGAPAQTRMLGGVVHEGRIALSYSATYGGRRVPGILGYELRSASRQVVASAEGGETQTTLLEPDEMRLLFAEGKWLVKVTGPGGWSDLRFAETTKRDP